MPAIQEEWKVLPHGALGAVDEGLLTVTGEIHMPLGSFTRRMTVARLAGGGSVIFSAIALDEPEMARIEAFGPPAWLVVPSAMHRMDAGIWKRRYPGIRVVTPEGARAKVETVVPVDAVSDVFGDPQVHFVTLPGTDAHESALEVRRPAGMTLVLNDIVGNIHDAHGVSGFLLKLAGFAGDEPQIPRMLKRGLVADEDALADQLRAWADDPELRRILVSHGDPIEDDPAGKLRAVAASLD